MRQQPQHNPEETTMTTWTHGSLVIRTDSKGTVVETNDPATFAVGEAAPARMLKACGWRQDSARKVTQYDVHGRKV
jgi:hypothetical protein